jgi:NADH:ubiquinone oxidoreductase subunit
MKSFLLHFFTWWNGATLGTYLWTWRKGEPVGEDQLGNRYYRERNGSRRWVIYKGVADGSSIPPGWHAWMHYRVDEPPRSGRKYEWEKPFEPNMTGTPFAYRPPGSILNPVPHTPPGDTDYEPWRPG